MKTSQTFINLPRSMESVISVSSPWSKPQASLLLQSAGSWGPIVILVGGGCSAAEGSDKYPYHVPLHSLTPLNVLAFGCPVFSLMV